MKTRLTHALMSATVALGALAAAPPAQATPQDIHVTGAWMHVMTTTGGSADHLVFELSDDIPLGVHGTVTASACGRVLGTLPFIGRRPDEHPGDGVSVIVNEVLVAEYSYTIRFSDPTMPVLEGTRAVDFPPNLPTCAQTTVNPTSPDLNEATIYNEAPYDYVVKRGKTKVNGKLHGVTPFKVGDTVKVTAPRLSLEAKTYGAQVAYEWTIHRVTRAGQVKGTKVVGTGTKVKVKRAWKGKILSATLIVSDDVFKHPYTTHVDGGSGQVK